MKSLSHRCLADVIHTHLLHTGRAAHTPCCPDSPNRTKIALKPLAAVVILHTLASDLFNYLLTLTQRPCAAPQLSPAAVFISLCVGFFFSPALPSAALISGFALCKCHTTLCNICRGRGGGGGGAHERLVIIKVCVFVCTSVTVSALSKMSSFIMKPPFLP